MENVLAAASDPDDLGPSQEFGTYLVEKRIDAVIFPSLAGSGANIAAFLDADPPAKVAIQNRDGILAAMKKFAGRIP